MVTAGANQAFTNVAVALLDASDKLILFSPYYFNHLMAIQVHLCSDTLPCASSLLPAVMSVLRWTDIEP